ncbi:PPR repeat [Musa troglodytarum]|uniref:PPR repeat n=1 Tax=Musa troglodytarum TaxID=320322 RepID=A0A9E7GV75_9LILI|nr:PPR repeat [Musa troglodytarum]
MDVAFTAKPQSPICSVSLPFSPGLLPLSTRREFLGCGSHLRPPSGLRSLKRFKKSGLQFHSPRCLSQEFSYQDSVLTAAAVVAAIAAFRFIYLNHKRKRRSESPKFSGLQVSDVTVGSGPCEQAAISRSKEGAVKEFMIDQHKQTMNRGSDIISERPHGFLHLDQAKKKQGLVSQADDLCHITSIGGQKSMLTRDNSQCPKETLACSEEEQLDFSQLLLDLRYQDALSKGSFLTAGAFQVMLLIKEAALKPDCKLYTTLISTCAKSGKVDAMFEVFHEMVNAGIEPNANTYGALIDGCARAGQVAKAFGAYGIMRSKKVQPDRVVFNALITACGEVGAVDRAFDVLAEMKAEPKPIDPDHVTVGALIKACTKAGQVELTREVYKMLQEYHITGTPEVYTIAAKSCSQTGDLEFALEIYDDMKRNGVIPDEMFLSTIIDVAGHAGKINAAFKILQEAKSDGIKVGNMSYSSLMGACCNAKDWKKALELYEEIKAIKLLPTVSLLNALVTSLFFYAWVACEGKIWQLQVTVELKETILTHEFHKDGPIHEVTNNVVFEGEADQLLKSVEVLDEMKKKGVQPNEITYSVLIVACESFKKAYSLGEPIVSFTTGRPQVDSKWTSLAIMVYRETIQAGVIPTIEVFSQVLGCLQFPRDSSLRNTFIENLGIGFDASRSSNVGSLLDGFGEYDIRSFSILEEATSLGVIPRTMKDNPVVVDARKLQIHTAEKGQFVNFMGMLLTSAERVGQAIGSLLRRLGLPYQGDESYGKIRINGLALRRWFKPRVTSTSFSGRPAEMIPTTARLAKGIADQQRSIRISKNLSLE